MIKDSSRSQALLKDRGLCCAAAPHPALLEDATVARRELVVLNQRFSPVPWSLLPFLRFLLVWTHFFIFSGDKNDLLFCGWVSLTLAKAYFHRRIRPRKYEPVRFISLINPHLAASKTGCGMVGTWQRPWDINQGLPTSPSCVSLLAY